MIARNQRNKKHQSKNTRGHNVTREKNEQTKYFKITQISRGHTDKLLKIKEKEEMLKPSWLRGDGGGVEYTIWKNKSAYHRVHLLGA